MYSHITTAKISMVALFEQQLAAKLIEGDLLAADGITTPPPFEYHRHETENVGGRPCVWLLISNSTPQSNSKAMVMRHRVIAKVELVGDDEQTLQTQLERYTWALRQVARDSYHAPDCPCGPIDAGEEAYTLVQASKNTEQPFVQAAFVELFVTTVE